MRLCKRHARLLTSLSLTLCSDYQRGEVTEQDWLDAVQAVKDAHPYPVDPSTIVVEPEPEVVSEPVEEV